MQRDQGSRSGKELDRDEIKDREEIMDSREEVLAKRSRIAKRSRLTKRSRMQLKYWLILLAAEEVGVA